MRYKKINEEVLIVRDSLVRIDRQFIEDLKKKSKNNLRKRIRLNIHKSLSDSIHEMFIVHNKGSYIRPHNHLNKNESLHIIEGRADIIFFDAKGNLTDVIPMGNYASGKTFYYKLTEPKFHSLLVKTDYLIFKETTNGPFRKEDRIDAPWSPDEKDAKAIEEYMLKLQAKVNNFRKK